jgi:cleavage stimulation factor subunit 3
MITVRILALSVWYYLDRSSFPDARALFERVIQTFPAERARPLWERWARYEYQFGDLEAAQKLEKRIAEVYPTGTFYRRSRHLRNGADVLSVTDPPIKRFAQRHTYLGTDAIAARDLGFAMAGRQQVGPGSSSSIEKRTDSLVSITSTAHIQPPQPPPKRQPSPDLKRREDSVKPDFAPPAKRPRPSSPIRDRDRDRFSDGPARKRFGSPAGWEKDRDRELHTIKRDREHEDKSSNLPAVLSWFVGQLPNPASFDGQFG